MSIFIAYIWVLSWIHIKSPPFPYNGKESGIKVLTSRLLVPTYTTEYRWQWVGENQQITIDLLPHRAVTYTYKSLFSCKTCKFNITAYTKAKKLSSDREAEYVFYVCTKKNRNVKCDEEQTSESALEKNSMALVQEYEISEDEGVECCVWLNRHYNDYIKKHGQQRPQWMRDKQKAQKALDTLDEKLESGVISDERHKDRAAIHLETLARTKQLLDANNTGAERWLELAKGTFSTVTNGDVFQIANDTERRLLMMYIGSNLYLRNKKWLSQIEDHLICYTIVRLKRFGGLDRIRTGDLLRDRET